jgi:hypothetical protein
MKSLTREEEAFLSAADFSSHLENLKKKMPHALSVCYLIAQPKTMTETNAEERDRLIAIKAYQNPVTPALPFYKAISTVLRYRNDD